jgi:hypothetical protein
VSERESLNPATSFGHVSVNYSELVLCIYMIVRVPVFNILFMCACACVTCTCIETKEFVPSAIVAVLGTYVCLSITSHSHHIR